MSQRTWKVRVIGVVSKVDGKRRIAVPVGEYSMKEVGIADYELTRDDGPTFKLTAIEAGIYVDTKQMKILDGTWP